MKINTLFLLYDQNSCFIFPGMTLSVCDSNIIWGGKRPPSAMHANHLLHLVQVVTWGWSERNTSKWIHTSIANFMLSISLNNHQFHGLLDFGSTLQPVHVFSYKALCPLRHRLHGCSFQSKRFHDLETTSKMTRFRRVYMEPIQLFMSRQSLSQAFALRQLDLGTIKSTYPCLPTICFLSWLRLQKNDAVNILMDRRWGRTSFKSDKQV